MSAPAAAREKIARYVASLPGYETPSPLSAPADRVAADPSDDGQSRPITSAEATLFGLIELLLKDQTRLDTLARNPDVQRELIPRLLTIGLIGYIVFGFAMSIIFSAAGVWPELTSVALWLEGSEGAILRFVPLQSAAWHKWLDGSVVALVAAFACGLLGANGICLPSFYFYSLLAGVRTTMLQVTVNALKGMAAGAIAVVGTLPIYFAAVLGLLVLPAPKILVEIVCVFGLLLPFIAGFWGTHSLYRGFIAMADTMPAECQQQRTCFLRRLVLAWSVCFTAVTPLMIFTLWEYFDR